MALAWRPHGNSRGRRAAGSRHLRPSRADQLPRPAAQLYCRPGQTCGNPPRWPAPACCPTLPAPAPGSSPPSPPCSRRRQGQQEWRAGRVLHWLSGQSAGPPSRQASSGPQQRPRQHPAACRQQQNEHLSSSSCCWRAAISSSFARLLADWASTWASSSSSAASISCKRASAWRLRYSARPSASCSRVTARRSFLFSLREGGAGQGREQLGT